MKKAYIIGVIIVVAIGGYVLIKNSNKVEYIKPEVSRPVAGNEGASIVLKEYSDYQCPACGAAHPVVKQVLTEFGDEVRFEMYHFPLISIHPFAFNAAVASECSNDQGKFWEMHDMLFANQRSLTLGDLNNYADQIGLDKELYSACMASGAHRKRVNDNISQGNALGVNSTPTFFLNNQKVDNWASLPVLIQMAINEQNQPADGGEGEE